jgi:hypothetical protein
MLSESEAMHLLEELCVKFGYCLSPTHRLRLAQNAPRDARAFADAVFVAEGLDVELADRHRYRQVYDMVAAAFERSAGDGK